MVIPFGPEQFRESAASRGIQGPSGRVPTTRTSSGTGRRGVTVLTPNQITKLLQLGPEQGGLTFIQALNEMKRYWEAQGRAPTEAARIAEQQLGGGPTPTPPPVPGGGPSAGGGVGTAPTAAAPIVPAAPPTGAGASFPTLEEERTPEQIRQGLSLTRGGRKTLFDQFIDELFEGRDINPVARRAAASEGALGRFNPLSARFALSQAQNPLAEDTDFRQFLATNPQPLTRGGFDQAIDAIRGLFDPSANLSFAQTGARDQLRASAAPLILQSAATGVNPFVRGAARDAATRRINLFQGQNPTQNLFDAFLRGDLGF